MTGVLNFGQPALVVAFALLIGGCKGYFTGRPIADGGDVGPSADADSDRFGGDGDGDGDADIDAPPEADLVIEADVSIEPEILSLAPSVGYTCGWQRDPRPPDDRTMRLVVAGTDISSDLEVIIGERVVADACEGQDDTSCLERVWVGDVEGTLQVDLRYPESSAVGEASVELAVGEDLLRWEGEPFRYELAPLEFVPDNLDLSYQTVSTLARGCFRRSREGGCAGAGMDVVIGGPLTPEEGRFSLLSLSDEGSAWISRWFGGEGHVITKVSTGAMVLTEDPDDVVHMVMAARTDHIEGFEWIGPVLGFESTTSWSLGSGTALGAVVADWNRGRPGDEVVALSFDEGSLRAQAICLSLIGCAVEPWNATILRPFNIMGLVAQRGSSAAADLDGDGSLDLAVPALGAEGGVVNILWGEGDGSFSDRMTRVDLAESCQAPGEIVALDADRSGDDLPDLVVGCAGDPHLEVIFTRPGRLFTEPEILRPEVSDRALNLIEIGSFNGDGIPDLVVGQSHSPTYSILMGTGSGDLAGAWEVLAGAPIVADLDLRDLTTADMDGDGLDDVILAGGEDEGAVIRLVPFIR